MGKRLVVLSGSPRPGGNTDRLAEAFIDGATAAGNRVGIFKVAGLKIGGCRGCGYCFRHKGACVQKDDMPPILAQLRQADALVLASPVYFFGISAQLKLAVDRFYALLEEGMGIKRAALLMTCGDDNPGAAAPAVSMFRQICAYQEWEEAGIVIAPLLNKPGDIEGRAELDQAKNLGGNI